MRYVRTKDGRIIDVSLMTECETDDDKGKRIFDGYEDNNGNYYPVENIIAQADTIKELCDEFVLINMKHIEYGYCLGTLEHLKNFVKKRNRDTSGNIYGAIWTDKGLIYVAKMNDKGELELL